MKSVFHCDIVDADQEIFSGLAEMVVAKSSNGEFGVKFGHTPLLTDLVPGMIKVVKHGGETISFFISGGFMEVQPAHIKILADTAIRAESADKAAKEKAIAEASKFKAKQNYDFDFSKASAHLADVSVQVSNIKKHKNQYK